ncbi:MAG: Fructose-bisphosphate aldolase [Candidatus Falkowbacteria bacterium GW2011_GWC2_38_22]|uniref:fructose-bisphosphate aldolase n=1 Tax=Candidatus Falkowbacteria bacterium GW2011_GWE1_38_31 TaxID=1618638 RepID=A0A0G0M807_9BACT|nr:MAG: Fructose-bisphosphate aldolase [Candidatus Falkowbacteria bacterium GW2011_GWF2_38_1205]KKQ60904.1 MAG: Fructose-bisphosphate aldolase [Candidatus Falkowbacteria bacterium GW2011_GWC2_38_22]KKQ63022.1 MAG: Fructose-bisphosphate aldolase [Candidatus Falkowbacteria bacterium GW2011_GWF1_38_22]KKQ65044.1 MAG: Fructose-bisphosphate aldolase [Candidatus Falkowbacteria bacterium GW2011_GWE2_38_254]KKQ69819.1 MAG: Fructose-bisphosphate aldolase [Candidatus Falkowbacteria bacterium GW2011_GWE1_
MNIPLSVPKNKESEYKKNFNTTTRGTGRMMMFAGDQKVEHLNDDFFGKDIPSEVADPEHYFKIAEKADIGVFATQLGLLSRYGRDYKNIPYLIKTNSKTNLLSTEYKDPFSNNWIKVSDVVKFKKQTGLNIVGVGYTLYIGSWYESAMFEQVSRMIFEAHQEGLLTVVWVYMRGRAIKDGEDLHLNAGGAGVALCLGADFIKIICPKDKDGKQKTEEFKEVVNAAGRSGIICVGGSKQSVPAFLQDLHDQIHIAGSRGCAVGRNIYQRPLDEAINMANAISAITLYGYSVEDALAVFEGKKKLIIKK